MQFSLVNTMDNFEDSADLDGDGEFDAIDMMVMEDEAKEQPPAPRGSSGCCVVLLGIGTSIGAGWWIVGNFLV